MGQPALSDKKAAGEDVVPKAHDADRGVRLYGEDVGERLYRTFARAQRSGSKSAFDGCAPEAPSATRSFGARIVHPKAVHESG